VASGAPDWRLRCALSVALVALFVTGLSVTFSHSPANVLTAVVPPVGHPPITPVTRPAPATTVVTETPAGTTARKQPNGGCGFSLSGQASATPTTVVQTSQAPVGHCTVLEIGDSLGNDIGWGLARHLAPATGVNLIQLDKSATGLANSSSYDWPAQLAADLHQYRPQLVVVCLGGNDEQGMEINGSAVHFPTPAWKSAYLARVRQLVSQATTSGAYVLWIGDPIMQQPSYSEGMQILNALYQQGVASESNATFLPTWSLFSNPQGAFQSSVMVDGTRTTLRQADGIHYSFAGEDVIATYVIREMALIYHVRLVPTNPEVITSWS
jgi:hypothetical protein